MWLVHLLKNGIQINIIFKKLIFNKILTSPRQPETGDK